MFNIYIYIIYIYIYVYIIYKLLAYISPFPSSQMQTQTTDHQALISIPAAAGCFNQLFMWELAGSCWASPPCKIWIFSIRIWLRSGPGTWCALEAEIGKVDSEVFQAMRQLLTPDAPNSIKSPTWDSRVIFDYRYYMILWFAVFSSLQSSDVMLPGATFREITVSNWHGIESYRQPLTGYERGVSENGACQIAILCHWKHFTRETDDKPVDFRAPFRVLATRSCPGSTAATWSWREHPKKTGELPWEILEWKVSAQFIPVVFHDFLRFAHGSCYHCLGPL